MHTHTLHEEKQAIFGHHPHQGHQCYNTAAPERKMPPSFSLLTHHPPFTVIPGNAKLWGPEETMEQGEHTH